MASYLETAMDIARESGALLATYFERRVAFELKGDFDLVTEQYWVLSDEYNTVLATTTLAKNEWEPWHRPITSPAIWTRDWGQGRVFVCTPGHDTNVVRDPNVTTIIERGMLWAAR